MTQTIIKPTHWRFQDLTNQRFGRLILVAFVETKNGRTFWKCRCDCGKELVASANNIKRNPTVSCGCFTKEKTLERCLKHGAARRGQRTPEYTAWRGIKARIKSSNPKDAPHYKDRNISICSRWINSFENFLADMGPRPSSRHSIDRIDNDGNYEPSNCRWATRKEQARNKTSNRKIGYQGKLLSLSEVSELSGLSYHTLRGRLRLGWPAEEITRTWNVNKQKV